jgi:A/G-specific adenine glycosylase
VRDPFKSINPDLLRGKFTVPLLKWYSKAGRKLPWRETRDPYSVWISEVMLQQTQVATVIPYYLRFIRELPTPLHLHEASLDRVLKLWEGLGYYSRARNLKKAAEAIVRCHGGGLPDDYELIQKLPGVGRSTAGAILSIAYGQRRPILDGNVRRVLCRFFAIRTDPTGKRIERDLWRCSESLIPERNPALFTQAIMDLGATVCTPRHPRCDDCPVANSCEAYRLRIQDSIPQKREKKTIPRFHHVAGIIQDGKKFLLRRRPQSGLLGGLWEFPGGRLLSGEPPGNGLIRLLSGELGLPIVATPREIGTVDHTFSHFKMTLHVLSIFFRRRLASLPEGFRWVHRDCIAELALPSAHLKILSLLGVG